jgi:hypothetical protein
MPRLELSEKLKQKYATMKTPLQRSKVLQNVYAKGNLFIARGLFGQTVGLTKEDADAALKLLWPGESDAKLAEGNSTEKTTRDHSPNDHGPENDDFSLLSSSTSSDEKCLLQ